MQCHSDLTLGPLGPAEGKDHQLDCKVDGAGEMMVTANFVKKA